MYYEAGSIKEKNVTAFAINKNIKKSYFSITANMMKVTCNNFKCTFSFPMFSKL